MKNITLDHCKLIKRAFGREAPVQRVDCKLDKDWSAEMQNTEFAGELIIKNWGGSVILTIRFQRGGLVSFLPQQRSRKLAAPIIDYLMCEESTEAV
nr:hypothetical protein [Achromobacter ruhlandii]